MPRNTNENRCFGVKIIIEKATSDLLGNGLGAQLEPAALEIASTRTEGAYRPPASGTGSPRRSGRRVDLGALERLEVGSRGL